MPKLANTKDNWDAGILLAMATPSCPACYGLGVKPSKQNNPCLCVMRAVFRACFAEFQRCLKAPPRLSSNMTAIASTNPKAPGGTFGFKNAEYQADFLLVADRALNAGKSKQDRLDEGIEESRESKIFRFHFLHGADWKLCCRRLSMDRGNFFHAVYRIEQVVGTAFATLEPFALFPIDDYRTAVKRVEVTPSKAIEESAAVARVRHAFPRHKRRSSASALQAAA